VELIDFLMRVLFIVDIRPNGIYALDVQNNRWEKRLSRKVGNKK